MNKKIIILLLAIFPAITQAQLGGLANRVKNKMNQKVNQRVDSKIDKAIDETLDKAEGKEPAGKTETTGSKNENATSNSIKSYTKYDFVPGEQIVYYDNFEGEATGELPTAWNTNGSGEVVALEGMPGHWLQVHKSFVYLSSNKKAFSENYTVEFDVIMNLKNNGWMFPTFSVGLIATGDAPTTDNSFLKEYQKNAAVLATLYPEANNNSRALVESHQENKSYFKSTPKEYPAMSQYFGKPMHIAIQVQKERFRVWINETKSFDVPKAIPANAVMNQVMFAVGATNYSEEQYSMYLSNIKVAQGIPDTRHKLVEEGKFSTTAILFDVNAATIKPESAAVLKEISGVLNQYKEMKIRIIGHTDSDGADAANLTLSQKRADAVRAALADEYGVDAARIETDGKGESMPVADNKTKEGKAANRRVEFVKL